MTLQAPLVKGEKKPETCEEQLRRMVKDIANDITSGEGDAAKWMENTYDIRYLVDQNKMFLGAEILVAGGGPTVWVNLWTKEVEGYWGSDRVIEPFIDEIGLDDYLEEMYASS